MIVHAGRSSFCYFRLATDSESDNVFLSALSGFVSVLLFSAVVNFLSPCVDYF